MNQLTTSIESASPFDSIKRYRENGSEYWCARELMPLLGYKKWERVPDVINRAKIACENSGNSSIGNFFEEARKTQGRAAQDWELSRYAAYLVAMNGDPRKSEIAAAQSYFAVKTNQAEVFDRQEIKNLPTHTAVEYIQAAVNLSNLPDSRLKQLLDQRLISELALDNVNQKMIGSTEQKQYTTATVRAAQLGYTAKQIGNGATLGKFIKQQIEPDFLDWQGQYKVNHYEVCEQFDQAIHNYFN